MYDFLDALITEQTSPEEAYRKFDDLANKHTEALRKATKQVQEARLNHDDNAVKKAVNDYEEALERYVPVLMAQAKIYWDLENYTQVEKIFKKSVEFCNEHDVWKLNVAHTLFMQENKFKDATRFYEPIVKKKYDNVSIKQDTNIFFHYYLAFFHNLHFIVLLFLDFRRERYSSRELVRQLYHDFAKRGS